MEYSELLNNMLNVYFNPYKEDALKYSYSVINKNSIKLPIIDIIYSIIVQIVILFLLPMFLFCFSYVYNI